MTTSEGRHIRIFEGRHTREGEGPRTLSLGLSLVLLGPSLVLLGPSLVLLGLSRYAGSWYIRAIGSLASSGGQETGSGRLSACRYMGGTRPYVEISGGGGEVVTVGPGPNLEVRTTWFTQITAQRYFWVLGQPAPNPDPRVGSERLLGIQLTGGLHDFEGIPQGRRLSLGLIASC